MSDHELLVFIANEIAQEIDGALIDAEAVNVATFGTPTPIIEIEYPDCMVSLTLTIDRDGYEEEANA